MYIWNLECYCKLNQEDIVMNFLSYLYMQICRLDKHLESCSQDAKRMRSEDRHGSSLSFDDTTHDMTHHAEKVEGVSGTLPHKISI